MPIMIFSDNIKDCKSLNSRQNKCTFQEGNKRIQRRSGKRNIMLTNSFQQCMQLCCSNTICNFSVFFFFRSYRYMHNSPSSRVHPNSGFYCLLVFQNKSGSRICEEQIALVPKTDWKKFFGQKRCKSQNACNCTLVRFQQQQKNLLLHVKTNALFFKNSNTDSFLSNSFFKFMFFKLFIPA